MNSTNNTNNTNKETKNSKDVEFLEKLKLKYFSSSFLAIRNFFMFTKYPIPEGVEADDLLHWEYEKSLYLAKEKTELENISILYQKTIIDRIDAAVASVEQIKEKIKNTNETKELKDLVYGLKQAAEIIDGSMDKLKISSYKSKDYEKNTSTINQKLKNI